MEHLLTELIGFDTVSHLSNENITRYVVEHLVRLGFETELTSYRDRRETAKFCLIARRDPSGSAVNNPSPHSSTPGLAYFCHTDVVSADRWSGPGGDPFRATIDNERLYGRGACDMKGSLAAMLAAASRVSIDDQTSPLWIVATADEEVGFEGAKHLVRSSQAYREIVASNPVSIIGEPTRLRVVYAHKGITGLQIHSVGQAAHSSTSEGVNANIAMVPMLQTLLEIDARCRHDKTLRDERFDPPTLTWNFGVSDQMKTVNIVPDHCTAWVSFRTMPNMDGGELIDEVVTRAAVLGLRVEEFAGGPPMATSRDQPCVGQMCTLVEPFIGPNKPTAVCYATDGCILDELTQRIVCGPGSIAQAHKTDEFISLKALHQGVDFYESAIRWWCGE